MTNALFPITNIPQEINLGKIVGNKFNDLRIKFFKHYLFNIEYKLCMEGS